MIHELCGGEDAKTDILLRAEHSALPYSLHLDQMWVSVLNAMDWKKIQNKRASDDDWEMY